MTFQWLVPILTFLAVASIGGALVLARHARRQSLRARLEAYGDAALGRTTPADNTPHASGQLLGRIAAAVAPGQASDDLRRRLAHAGYFAPAAPTIYSGLRVIAVALGLVIAAAIVLPMDLMLPIKFMIAVGSAWVLSLLPSLVVDLRRNARSTEIRHHLPDAVDMMEICVSSGMGLDMAWNSVSEEIRRVCPVLADEMALTNLEIHLGADRADAMRHMAERTSSEDISSLVATLVQSERFGTAIADALRVFAASMREARQARAAEAAEKLGIKMLIPMILFILPAILIVMGGSAFIKILQMFQSL